jgi:AcrR family transcriptional regulator
MAVLPSVSYDIDHTLGDEDRSTVTAMSATTAKVSLREKHALETRQRIVDEALRLFVEVGYDAATVDEIAERADVSPRTFFRYFATKEALLFHDFEDQLSRLQDEIGARPVGEAPGTSLVAVLCAMIDDLRTSPEQRALVRRLLEERPSLRSYQRMTIAEHSEGMIAAALARHAGLDPSDLGLRAMVAAVGACFDVALRDWVSDDTPDAFEEHFAATLAACVASFPASLPTC